MSEQPATWDEWLQRFADVVAAERASQWELGDWVVKIINAHGGSREVYGGLAQVAGRSRVAIQQWEAVARAFEPGCREPLRNWSWHRAVRLAAQRTGRLPAEMASLAQLADWGEAQLNRVGRLEQPVRQRLRAVCPCGWEVLLIAPLVPEAGSLAMPSAVRCPGGCPDPLRLDEGR